MKKYFNLLGFLLSIHCSFAQNGQDVEHLKPKSVEEILMKENPNKARALFNKEKFLVVENLRTGSRNRFYIGDIFRCKTKDGFIFEEDIREITDSSYITAAYNDVFSRFEYHEVKLNEIQKIYKKPAKGKFRLGFTWAPLGYLLLDWAAYGISPLKSQSWPIIGALEVGNLLIYNAGQMFKSRKISDTYRVRVFQNY